MLSLSVSAHTQTQTQKNLIPVSGLDRGTIILPYTEGVDNIEYEFTKEPTPIMTSYYDYMPGGLNGYVEKQTDNGSGAYFIFHGQEYDFANRLQYWTYINENGSIDGPWKIKDFDLWPQGYGTCTIHPATGNCIASWHENEWSSNYGCTICYDDYALLQIPGFWSATNFIPSPLPDEYIWPQLYAGPSPNGDDWIRIYHISQNFTPDPYGHSCKDPRILYIDIENSIYADLTQLLNLNNWTSVTPMYYWREKSCNPRSLSFAINYNNPGRVSLIGYCVWNEGDLGDMPVNPGLFVWESMDYGTNWWIENIYSHNQGQGTAFYQVDNLPQFEFNGTIPNCLDVDIKYYNTANTALYDDFGNLHTTFLASYSYTDPEIKDQYYLMYFLPQIEAIWRPNDEQFYFNEIPQLPGHDTFSGQSVPWEIIENDTILYVVVACHEECYGSRQTNLISTSPNAYLHCWTDATYSTLAQLGYSQYDEYLEHPIICLGGRYVWTNGLLELTDINNPNFDFSDQITVYPYTTKDIELDDYFQGKIILYYFDDNSYGSYVQGLGDNLGGQINYCILKLLPDYGIDENIQESKIRLSNLPNPFKTSTRISYSGKKTLDNNAEFRIYNAKGQLVRRLSLTHKTPQSGYADWGGKDLHGKKVANGIYLYKVAGDISAVGKLLLTR